MRLDSANEWVVIGRSSAFDIQINAVVEEKEKDESLAFLRLGRMRTNPSRTAEPNGRVVLLPPRNKFQIFYTDI